MPYSSNAELPDYVKKLPAKQQRRWRHIVNGALAAGKDEATAFRMANGVVKSVDADADTLAVLVDQPASDSTELIEATKDYQWVGAYEYEERKLSQEEANYRPTGGDVKKACSNCRFFVSPARCSVVAGTIAPNGLSDEWRGVSVDPLAGAVPVYLVGGGSLGKETVEAVSKSATLAPTEEKDGVFKKMIRALVGLTNFSGTNSESHKATPDPAVTRGGGVGIAFYKNAAGEVRWLARYSNAWEDRDKEILTEAAHKDYIDWVYASGNFPELWLWHTPGTKVGKADWLDFSDGFAHASGLVDSGREAIIEKLADEEVGVSHGFFGKQEGKYVTKYRSFEISVLPLNRAAVWTTDFNVVAKGKDTLMPFNKDRREFLVGLIGEEKTAELETGSGALATQLKELKIDYKETDPNGGEGDDGEGDGGKEPVTANAKAVDNDGLKVLAGMFGELTKSVTDLTATVVKLKENSEKTDDTKVADAIIARAASAAGYRPTQDANNVTTKEEGSKTEDYLNQMLKESGFMPSSSNGVGTPAVGAVTIK